MTLTWGVGGESDLFRQPLTKGVIVITKLMNSPFKY
jgi:hypothetical protein